MPQYCTVYHRVDSVKIDGEDTGRDPDRIPVSGTIVFTPLLDKGDSVVITEDGVESTLNIEPVTAQIQLGQLMHRGELGVKLFAGGEDSNPERIRWRAAFKHLIAGTTQVALKDILFEAVPGGELTLSMAQPVPGKPYPGYSATIEQGISEIESARDEALGQVDGAVGEAIDTRLLPLEGEVSNAVSVIANASGNADRLVKLNQDGKLRVLTTSITDPQHVANREYVDTSRRRAPVATGDLNHLTTPDVYRLAITGESTLENHYPEPGILGTLEVYSSGASVTSTSFPTQRITTWSITPRIYIRRYTGATWSRWQTFTSDAERSTQDFTTLDPDGYHAPAGHKLTLPTHDGSGQATHPSVLHFPEGFGGYRYWMAMTPFPNGNDAHEDPNILASQDGTTWVVPDGLTNPLDDAPGNPQYNSDTCLSMGPGNTMWCFWRFLDRLNGAEVIYGRSTTDGVTWTPRVEIIRNDDADGNLNRLLSPSLVYDSRGAGSWRLWVVNTSDRSPDAHDSVKLKHTTGPTGWNFTAWQNVTVAPLQNRYRPWHMSVRYVEGKYVGILCAADSLVQATYDNLMLVGDSPTNFRVSSVPSIERTSSQHTSLYRSSMVPVVTPSGLEWDAFYSGIYAPTNTWYIFRTRMGRRKLGSLRDSIEEKITPPDSGWRDISDTLREGWTGKVRIRRIGWEIFVELDSVIRESGTDFRMINLPRFGFLPTFSTRRDIFTSTKKTLALSIYSWVGDLGSIQVEGSTIGESLRGGFSFLTSDKPPSEWPGAPVE